MALQAYSLARDGEAYLSPHFRVQGASVEEVAACAERLLHGCGGVGRYPAKAGRAAGWVHVDTRAEKARWRG